MFLKLFFAQKNYKSMWGKRILKKKRAEKRDLVKRKAAKKMEDKMKKKEGNVVAFGSYISADL